MLPSAASLFVGPGAFRIVVISLFSGIGGFERSLVDLRFNQRDVLVLAFESSVPCRAVLAASSLDPATSIISDAVDTSGLQGCFLSL